MRIVFKEDGNLHVFNLNKTSNKKICADPKEKIVQTYVFSREQFEHVLTGTKDLSGFYSKANSNCLDCPMREYGKCYTHKYMQTAGFYSMLRSVGKEFPCWEQVPEMSSGMLSKIVAMATSKYVRFGTYGEPVLHGWMLVKSITLVAKNWTGYTHQWRDYPHFAEFFMASVHSHEIEAVARGEGWRSFASLKSPSVELVNCPASKEGGFRTSCDKCGLCSGQGGKGSKSIYILEH